MKKRILPFVICLLSFFPIQAQEAGVTFHVTEDNFQQLQVTFSVSGLQMDKTEINGHEFTRVDVFGMQPSSQVGAPNLPIWSALLEVPVCNGYEVEVSGMVYDTLPLTGNRVVPSQPSRSKSDQKEHQLSIDEKLYSTNGFYEVAPLAMVEHVGVARDRNLARLQFSPVSYNPVSKMLVVCKQAMVTVRYKGADEGKSMSMFNRYYSPMFGVSQVTMNELYPKSVRTTAPVRYLIVAHSMFRGQLDEFVNWKRRKGFITDIVYTDDAGVGTTSTNIAAYVRSQYTNATAASPAPTYLLIVGDHEQIPAFSSQLTSSDNDHITDLYYASWTTGDHIPDCYMGRFSAQNVSQLTPQVEKTLMYEQYAFADPSFLDRAVMVAGVDGGSSGDYGYTHADPAMDYAITNYVNGAHGFSQVKYFKNNTSIVPTGSNVTVGSSSSSNSATVRSCYNEGAGWINYSAHGSATSWGTPSFTTSHAAAMTNTQKFGVMIGNCCLTNKFETSTCLGESVLRKGNYCGAVGYIGGSNSTYWSEDFYWAVGVRSGIGPTMSMAYNSSNLGVYDRAFHTHNEVWSDWATTQGSIVMLGNMAVENSSSGRKYYYWEIYHLMGDPSVMPWLTQAPAMTLTSSSVITVGTSALSVSAAPYAYVALTDTLTRTLWVSGFADASGHVTLALPSGMPVGGYELAASAQQYQTAFKDVTVVPASGPYPVVVDITPTASFDAGSTVPLRIAVANLGNSAATGVTVMLSTNSSEVALSGSTLNVGNLATGDTVFVTTVSAMAVPDAPDATRATVTASTQWSGSSTPTTYNADLTVNAALVMMTVTPSSTSVLPDSNMVISVDLTNGGHATLGSSHLSVTTGNPFLTVSSVGGNFTLDPNATFSRQYQLHAAATIDTDIFVPVYIHLAGPQVVDDTLQIYIGVNSTETFEGGLYHVEGWTQGVYPWTLTSTEAYEGSWSARSAVSLGHNNTSEMSINFNTARADSVSFYYKVSSESNYDKFRCHLDNAEMLSASGETGWVRYSFPVAAGSHELRFAYSKDVSMDSGSDCAWIDNIVLPHGTAGAGTQGGGETPNTFDNLIATFESADDDNRWTLANGSLTNVWTIGAAAANGSGRGLYISNDGGQTNSYAISSQASVFAYTTLWLDTGTYNASFDWRCNGESNYDFMRAALVPAATMLTAGSSLPSGWSTTTLPNGSIALDGGQKLNLSSSWNTNETEVHVSQSGSYNLVFLWCNDNSVGEMPPAAIDNVRLLRSVRHTVNVTASHGVTTGSGEYLEGETVTVGVFPEAGYTFAGWSDGNDDNPRQLLVNADYNLTATLSQGGVVVMHDTTFINVPVHDTTFVHVPVHDTAYINVFVHDTVEVPVHDTTVVTLTDTISVTETIVQIDTLILTDTVTLTEFVTVTDTLTLTEYVPVHDTTMLTLTDTLTVFDTVTMTDTLTLIEYVPVHDTTIVFDTLTLTEYVPVHDTTVIYSDTILLTEYIEVHDTTVFYYDTLTLTEYVPVHDTTVLTMVDTIMLTDTIVMVDTLTSIEYVSIHDTTVMIQTDTVTLTEYVPVHDTTVMIQTDTVTLTEYVPVHDTMVMIQTDTVTLTEYVPVHDTMVMIQTDTVTLTEYVPVHDTTVMIQTDTVSLIEYVPIHDTTVIIQTDTVMLTEYVTVIDTIIITNTDTITNTVFDTVTNIVYDTINNFYFDTTFVTDTLWLTEYDTLILYDTLVVHDTIVIHDTIYVTDQGVDEVETMAIKVYPSQGHIVIEGANGGMVTLYDVTGRILATKRDEYMPLRFDVPSSGTYLIKADQHPARRIVVVR